MSAGHLEAIDIERFLDECCFPYPRLYDCFQLKSQRIVVE